MVSIWEIEASMVVEIVVFVEVRSVFIVRMLKKKDSMLKGSSREYKSASVVNIRLRFLVSFECFINVPHKFKMENLVEILKVFLKKMSVNICRTKLL